MSCEQFENLLPLYAEGELDQEERCGVDEHVASCGACRESLAFYQELETSLASLRDLRPSPARTAALASERLGLRRRWDLREAFASLPALASAGFIALGIVLYIFRGPVENFFARMGAGASSGYSRVVTDWTQGAVQLSGGGEWVLLSVLSGVFALVMLAGSWMVLRFVKR